MRWLLLCVSACSTSVVAMDATVNDASNEGSSDAAGCTAPDASFACDVSKVAASQRTCAHWAGEPSDSGAGSTICPAPLGKWTGSIGGGMGCGYDWDDFVDMKPPDLCRLPSENGRGAFDWLHPTCDAGCP